MGFGGISGEFRELCIKSFLALKKQSTGFRLLLEAMMWDPIVDWAAEKHERAAKKAQF